MFRWTIPCAVLAFAVTPVLAVFPPPMKDDGKFFSRETTDRVNKKIRELYEKYKKDVVIETLNTLTAEQEKKWKDDGEARFFNRLANDRAKELGLNGIYILIVKKPRYLRIHMDPQTQKKEFTGADRDATFKKIVAQFREDRFDEGILDGLSEIESALKGPAKRPTSEK